MISPLLANIYLHYVFDLWAERWRRREATGDMIIVRYADDIVVGFEHEADARRFLDAMRAAVRGVCAVAASGQDPPDRVRPPCGGERERRGLGKPETFNFLGFTFICGKSRRGNFLLQAEDPPRPHAGEAQGNQGGTATANASANPRTGEWLRQVVSGFFNYHAVPTNCPRTRGLPTPCHRPLAAHASAAQPEGSARPGSGSRSWPTTGSPNPASSTPGRANASPSNTQGEAACGKACRRQSAGGVLGNGRACALACARLSKPYLTGSSPAFSATFTTTALYRRSLRWFEAYP